MSKGFGTGPFGLFAFGAGLPDQGESLPPNLAIRYLDPNTKDFAANEDGTFQEMPSTRQRVLLALATTKGTAAGLDTFGSTHPLIGVIDSQFDSKVNNSVREALKQLTEVEKIITLDGVEIVKSPNGRVEITVSYTDLISQDQDDLSLTL